ncbi:MAG: DUF1993 domain-containing protein [Alphaproteobacteria bacterium]|nr:DUF1993 domain-containing protein [Alphaproteobacteria bacterium]
MSLSMHQASAPVFVQMLTSLRAILDKAEAHCTAKKIDPAVILGARLFPDMFPLTRQVQLTSDFAKGPMARLAGQEPPKWDDKEASFGELRARIDKTIEFVKSFRPDQIDGAETRDVTIPIGGNPTTFKGQRYLIGFALPNFFFHHTAAYSILRHNGIEIGKRDYLGQY